MRSQYCYIYNPHFLAVVFCMVMACACKKIEIEQPDHLLTTDAVFADDKTATAAVTGIYSRMMQNRLFFAAGAMSVYPALSADELTNTFPNSGWDAFKNNTLLSADGIVRNNIWRLGYFHIYQANAVIEGLASANNVSPALKKQLIGEARFVRAFCHFYLVNLFGEVPLIVSTDYRINSAVGRAAIETVYQQIVTDLKDAKGSFTETYASAGKVRPNKWVASALLARVYLYQNNWALAEAEANEIIQSNKYLLEPNLEKVFLANSPEAIWQLMPVINNTPGNNTHEGFYFNPACAACVPDFLLRDSLINAFEPGDQRKTVWVGTKTLNGKTYNYPYKYKVRSSYPSAPTEYSMVLRLAEQYLIRAEARAWQNKLADALADINFIRQRASLAELAPAQKDEVLVAIERERRLELFVEWGHRWFDLKRTGKADALLAPVKGASWQASDVLYPIPFMEIQVNPALVQNPGY